MLTAAGASVVGEGGQMSETNEDTGLAAEDTIFAAEDTGLATKDIVPTTGKESVVPPLDEIRAEPAPPSIAASVEETIVETSVDAVAEILEAALAEDFEVLEELGKEGLKAAKSAASSFSGSFRMFATETRDYTKNCFESRAAFVGALLDAKSLQSAVRIQTRVSPRPFPRACHENERALLEPSRRGVQANRKSHGQGRPREGVGPRDAGRARFEGMAGAPKAPGAYGGGLHKGKR